MTLKKVLDRLKDNINSELTYVVKSEDYINLAKALRIVQIIEQNAQKVKEKE